MARRHTRSKSYYVAMPLVHFRNICNTIRYLNSIVYQVLPFESKDEVIIVDDDETPIGDWWMVLNPDESKRDTPQYTSGEVAAMIHKIAEGAEINE